MDGLNRTLHRLLSLCRLDRTWTRGAGVWLTDDHGRRFLDCYARYGAVLAAGPGLLAAGVLALPGVALVAGWRLWVRPAGVTTAPAPLRE